MIGSYICIPALTEVGYLTFVGGMAIQTRFPWAAFNEEWQDGLVAYARSEYENAKRAGNAVQKVCIDHINLERKSFHPRIDLKGL